MLRQTQLINKSRVDEIIHNQLSGIALTDEVNEFKTCPYCKEEIRLDAIKCRHCQSRINSWEDVKHRDMTAVLLAVFLGVVGLWYKGQWAAGFAWIVGAILFFIMTGGLGLIFLPVFWIGIIVHAGVAKDRS